MVRYDTPVYHHHFLLRCLPYICEHQNVVEQKFDMLTSAKISHTRDIFGSSVSYGLMKDSHDIFVVTSSGVVECGDYRVVEQTPLPIYLTSTIKTAATAAMVSLIGDIDRSATPLEQALDLSQKIYSHMQYMAGETDTETSASEAFSLGKGVCQDYSHILIALLRELSIYSRYVVGFVVGTGETHAWVEVYSDGVWYGVDPTYNHIIEHGYIKVAMGRDASDCSVSRGVHRGISDHTTDVQVVVEELP